MITFTLDILYLITVIIYTIYLLYTLIFLCNFQCTVQSLHSGNKIGWKYFINKSHLFKKNVWFASLKT